MTRVQWMKGARSGIRAFCVNELTFYPPNQWGWLWKATLVVKFSEHSSQGQGVALNISKHRTTYLNFFTGCGCFPSHRWSNQRGFSTMLAAVLSKWVSLAFTYGPWIFVCLKTYLFCHDLPSHQHVPSSEMIHWPSVLWETGSSSGLPGEARSWSYCSSAWSARFGISANERNDVVSLLSAGNSFPTSLIWSLSDFKVETMALKSKLNHGIACAPGIACVLQH